MAAPVDSAGRHRMFARHLARRNSWDQPSIVAAVREWHRQTGEVVRSYDWCPSAARAAGIFDDTPTKWEREHPRWPGSTTVYRYFDCWGDVVRAAGLQPRSAGRRLPIADRVRIAQQLHADGRSAREIADSVGVSVATARRYLTTHPCKDCAGPVVGAGALCQACATRAGNPRRWDRDELFVLGIDWTIETGQLPSQQDWSASLSPADKWHREFPRWPPASVVRQAYGGWNAFRVALGGNEYQPRWTADEVVDAIRCWAGEHGSPPTKSAWECPPDGYPSAPTVRRRFGTFRAALEASGYVGARPAWTDEALIAAIRRHEARHGRPPRPTDWQRATPGQPTTATVVRRFGSWEVALAAAAR